MRDAARARSSARRYAGADELPGGWVAVLVQAVPQERVMLIKIHRGTPVDGGDSLCESCRHSRVIQGRSLDEEIVFCDAVAMQTVRIPFKVTSCSDYDDVHLPSYHELMAQAWILQPGSKRRRAGFVRASELEDDTPWRCRSHDRDE
jgi:hypothetical protein